MQSFENIAQVFFEEASQFIVQVVPRHDDMHVLKSKFQKIVRYRLSSTRFITEQVRPEANFEALHRSDDSRFNLQSITPLAESPISSECSLLQTRFSAIA
jgi:hypothetical protein